MEAGRMQSKICALFVLLVQRTESGCNSEQNPVSQMSDEVRVSVRNTDRDGAHESRHHIDIGLQSEVSPQLVDEVARIALTQRPDGVRSDWCDAKLGVLAKNAKGRVGGCGSVIAARAHQKREQLTHCSPHTQNASQAESKCKHRSDKKM
jgi:hypothetical protein